MGRIPLYILVSAVITFLFGHGSADPNLIYTYCPNSTFFPATNSAFRSNIDSLLLNLTLAANISSIPGFHTTIVGSGSDSTVYGLYLCRGDDDPATCRDCLAAAYSELSQNCPRGKQAVTWYDQCMVRYSNESISGLLDDGLYLPMWNAQNITGNVTLFKSVLTTTLEKVVTEAASGGATLKFATEEAMFSEFQTLYVLGQCTPDLSTDDCNKCLQQGISKLPANGNTMGARVLFLSCSLRYEIYLFYRPVWTSISPISIYCPNTTFFSVTNSAYRVNINALLFNLSTAANQSTNPGFYNTTIGSGTPAVVYGLYLCRGDVISATCRDCVAAALVDLPKNCSRGKQAVILYDQCMIRYSNEPFLGHLEPNSPFYTRPSTTNSITDPNFILGFQRQLGTAIAMVINNATVKEEGGEMFGTDQEKITGTDYTIYILGQCTPDLSTDECKQCLDNCSSSLGDCCMQQQEAGVYFFSCNIRYALDQFYSSAPGSNLPTLITNTSGIGTPMPNKSTPHISLIISVSVLVTIVLLILGLFLLVSVCKSKVKATSTAELSDIVNTDSLQMDFNTIRAATQNFAIDRKLGQGGFGSVYKGTLDNGQDIAVKRLSNNSGQGIVEFKTEVLVVAKLQHRNLVKLLGFCVSGDEKILVYEYLPNSSLDQILFDPTKRMTLNWEMRFKIICGIAKGLMYLHEDSRLRVVHRDLKSSNILLDEVMNPKISDFGLAKLFGVDQTQAVTDSIAGTYGYMAPEYVLMGHYSIKSDVYSFGIIVLEVITGQRNKYLNRPLLEEALLYRAWKLWNEGEPVKLLDEMVGDCYSREDVLKCIHIGLLCIQENVAKRPNMTSIVAALGGQSITLPLPSPPNYFNSSDTTSTVNTSTVGSSSGQGVGVSDTSDITELHGR